MASSPIISRKIDEKTMETVTDFIFLCSKITVDGDSSHKLKRRLLLGKKAMTKLDSLLKSRNITLLTKIRIVIAIIFPVVMYRCESWTIKKAELLRIQFSHSVMSDSLQPHGLQHARPPCPSPTPGGCSNSGPLSRWCHPTMSPSVISFSSCLQSLPASGSFSMSQLAKVLEFQLQHQSFQWIFRTDFL